MRKNTGRKKAERKIKKEEGKRDDQKKRGITENTRWPHK